MGARLVVIACTVAMLMACGDEGGAPSRVCGEQPCTADCQQLSGSNCDILDAACQRRVFDAVVCVRGTPAEMPGVRTITPEEYRAELLAAGDEDAGAGDDSDQGSWSRALQLVQLVDDDSSIEEASIEDRATNVAGYYNSATGQITLIDRDRAEASDGAVSLLAHELVHALQDQEMGLSELGERTGRSTDSWYARTCLVEGEATLYEDLALTLLQGRAVDPGYWDVNLAWYLKSAHGDIASSKSPYAALWRLTYPVGARFLSDAWLDGGNHAVQSVYWAVPQATIYWMHGYEAVRAREGQLVRPLACNDAAAPEGYAREQAASLGAFAVYALLARVDERREIPPIGAAWRDALHWRQDSLTVFVNDEGRVAVSWRILFEDGAAAQSAEQLIERLLGVSSDLSNASRWILRGAEVEVLAADDVALLDGWGGTNPEACQVEQ